MKVEIEINCDEPVDKNVFREEAAKILRCVARELQGDMGDLIREMRTKAALPIDYSLIVTVTEDEKPSEPQATCPYCGEPRPIVEGSDRCQGCLDWLAEPTA